jgi:isopenicillin-N epimerase
MPTFGRSMLEHWFLDPSVTYLNHGTVGAPPRRVLARQQALREELERQPSRFMLRDLGGYLPAPWRERFRIKEAAGEVATFLGARAEDIAFAANVTTAINAVLRSVPLGPGAEILITDLGYGAIDMAAGFIAKERGLALRTVEVPYPVRDPGAVVDTVVSAVGPDTRLAIIDHITSETGLVLPVAAIAAECRRRGALVLVDGAHAPGSIHLDIPALGVDFYAGNLHKWAHAPRSCGVLWAHPERQQDLHHPVVSWGLGKGYPEEFEWSGTTDPTPYLAAPEGIAMLHEWGFDEVLGYMHGLARAGAGLLAERWGTELCTPPSMLGALATVPLPERAGSTVEDANRLRLELLLEDRIEVQLHAARERLWVRISAQIYNEMADIERLAEALAARVG